MLRAGFIGTGGIAAVHLAFLKGREDIDITALCDVNEDAAQKRSEEFGGRVFTDFDQMLGEVELDAVWLCTPPQVRREPLLACARRGIPVLCEKPVERSAEAGAKIAAELASLDAHVQVGYCFRSIPCLPKLREAMADDKIHVAQSLYVCDMSLSDGVASWFFDKEKSGGALIDQATHNLDLLRFLFGEVREIRAVAGNPVRAKEPGYTIDETVALVLGFEKSASGTATSSGRHGPLVTHAHTWVGDGWRNEIVLSGEKRLYRLDLNAMQVTIEDRTGRRVIPKDDDLRLWDYQNIAFLGRIASGDWSGNPSDYADGLKTLELTLACDKALV